MTSYLVVQQGTPPGNWIGTPDRTHTERIRGGNVTRAFAALCDGRGWPVGELLRVATVEETGEDDAARTAQHMGEWLGAVVIGPDSGLTDVLRLLGYTVRTDAAGWLVERAGKTVRTGNTSELWLWLHDSLQVVEIPDEEEEIADLEARLAAELRAADRAAYEDACERRGDEQREEA